MPSSFVFLHNVYSSSSCCYDWLHSGKDRLGGKDNLIKRQARCPASLHSTHCRNQGSRDPLDWPCSSCMSLLTVHLIHHVFFLSPCVNYLTTPSTQSIDLSLNLSIDQCQCMSICRSMRATLMVLRSATMLFFTVHAVVASSPLPVLLNISVNASERLGCPSCDVMCCVLMWCDVMWCDVMWWCLDWGPVYCRCL